MPSCNMNLEYIRSVCLKTINAFRKRHNLEQLIREHELEASATEWSVVLARIARNTPSQHVGQYYGENIAVKRKANNNLTGWEIAAMWYAEGYGYCYDVEGPTDINCNYTQLIWASSREFGLGITLSKEGDAYIVGHFRQMGNINGAFKFNVFDQCELYRPPQPNLEEMNIIGLNEHNRYRKRHGVPPLIICHDLVASAQKWADTIAPLKGMIQYSNKCSISESIAHKFDPLGHICSRRVTQTWYGYGREYDFINHSLGSIADLFTQLIWKDTTDVGFGRATFDGHHYLVVHYRPPGNMSSFKENVFGLTDDYI